MMDFGAVEDAFKQAVAQGVFPGAVVLVGKGEETVFEKTFGFRSLVPERTLIRTDTIFDLASLTKPLATGIALMLLVKEKKIRLDDRVTRFFPNFGVFGKNHVTFRHLLAHCSGLPAWKAYYEEIVKTERGGKVGFVSSRRAKSYVFDQIHREKLLFPPGSGSLYSDLGFIFLAEIVEEIMGQTLDRYCQEKIYGPLGLKATFFFDITQLWMRRARTGHENIAPAENCPWRKEILCGEVHDDNAYAMGGVAGHAGLFSSARDIRCLLLRLRSCYEGRDSFLPAQVVQEFFTRDGSVEGATPALGWDTPASHDSSSGSRFSPQSVGHLGFTGTSIWWDLEKDCQIILLTNRIHPSRNNEKIKEFRPYIHDLIMRSLF
ncbi:MAG: serine hydrolase [Candidatus Binatia bacterium]|jgi:CubicO group peptidase (beta-lactamase class C family)|nr:serine hydrolase [Candidatus Binatia bacterium]